VLFDRGDAREGVVNLFAVAGHVADFFVEVVVLASQLVVYEARQGLWADRALNSPIRPQPGTRA